MEFGGLALKLLKLTHLATQQGALQQQQGPEAQHAAQRDQADQGTSLQEGFPLSQGGRNGFNAEGASPLAQQVEHQGSLGLAIAIDPGGGRHGSSSATARPSITSESKGVE